MELKKADLTFLILIIIITIFSIDLILFPEHRELIENVSSTEPFQNMESALIITFVVCLIGNLLPVPTPYTWVVCYGSAPFIGLNLFIPILVGIIASLGCLVGEMGGYLVGRGTAEFIDIESKETLTGLRKYLVEHPKAAPLMIFLFGLTPLNDDILIVPLGLIKYSAKKTIFFCWLGKLGLMLIFAYDPFSICRYLGGENWIFSILSLYGIIIVVYLLIRVNIFKVLNKK